MSIELSVFTGGLLFAEPPRIDDPFVESSLRYYLADNNQTVVSVTNPDPSNLEIVCDNLVLWLKIGNGDSETTKLRVTVKPILNANDPENPAHSSAKSILAVVLAVLARDLKADSVTWLGKELPVPARQFILAVFPVIPRRVRTGPTYDQIERVRLLPQESPLVIPNEVTFSDFDNWNFDREESRKLLNPNGEEEAESEVSQNPASLPLRITTWIMTALVAIFSVPLAWIMFAFNLNRGGDFATTARVLAAVGGLAILHANGGTDVLFRLLF
ncbi:hypothetical protein RXV86_03785 [Alisedimentitalea sp. MJ-SS2]|uniref:hypothetical protein n=1 Tax=Aliisedimentitalea sp. MJ-SS2 TaxID=3049795 RepID=UPI00290AC385|nr:hypothetical protein [Alisedimentitalea sp. MJ-SS2]MDU8926499.1 hypothetical protein [Alisedimentitalea sp. MJ-SS2]